MMTGATGRTLALVCLAVAACANEPGADRSSWDARPVAASPLVAGGGADGAPAITRAEDVRMTRPAGDPSLSARREEGPLPIARPSVPAADRFAAREVGSPPAVTAKPANRPIPPECPSYGNKAAAILEAQIFPTESARMAASYQVSDSATMVSFWRHTPLVVLGLEGRPVYCVAERIDGSYRVPAGRRICFADPDGDFLFDRVFIVQAEPKSYMTAPVRYELNPLQAARQASSVCQVPG